MDVSWFQAVAVVLAGYLWMTAIVVPLLLWSDGVSAARQNKRLRQISGRPAEMWQARSSLFVQLGGSAMMGAVVGFLTSVSSSYITSSGRFRWVDSTVPLMVLAAAILLAEFGGIFVTLWLDRPLENWITNPWTLAATVEQASARGDIPSAQITTFETKYQTLLERAARPGWRTREGLRRLGLWSAVAELEWPADQTHDPAAWAGRIRADVSQRQVRHWLVRRHRWALVLLAVCVVLSGAVTAFVPLPSPWPRVLQILGIGVLIVLLSAVQPVLRAARHELVLANRLGAQEQAALASCRSLLDLLNARQRVAEPDLTPRLVFALGQWRLYPRAGADHIAVRVLPDADDPDPALTELASARAGRRACRTTPFTRRAWQAEIVALLRAERPPQSRVKGS